MKEKIKGRAVDFLLQAVSIFNINKIDSTAFKEEILTINMKRVFILSHIFIPISLIHIIIFQSSNLYHSDIEILWKNKIIMIHTIIIIILLVFTLLSYILSGLKQRDKYLTLKKVLINFTVISTIYVGILITVIDQYIIRSITPFIIACIVVSLLFIMNPLYSLTVFSLTFFVFDHAMEKFLANPLLRLSNQGKAITVVSISFSLSLVLWNYYVSSNNQKMHIAQQKIELEMKNRELMESNAIKDKLFSIITHDIRQPLASILNLTELMEEINHLDPEYYEMVHYVKKQMVNSFSMIEKLFEWCKYQKNGFLYHPELIPVSELIKDNLDIIKPHAVRKNIQILHEAEEYEDIVIYADREMMNLVLRNILSNAVKFSYKGGCVCIRTRQSLERTMIEIIDNGMGMDHDKVSKLFHANEMVAAAPGTEGEKGTGLGLYLCKEFIRKNHGSLWAESTLGKGSTFYLSIPSAKAFLQEN